MLDILTLVAAHPSGYMSATILESRDQLSYLFIKYITHPKVNEIF